MALLGLALFTPSAGARLWVDPAEGDDGALVAIYEAEHPDQPPAADFLAVSQPSGPNSLRFAITEGTAVIGYIGGSPCTGFLTQVVTCEFTEGIDHLEVTLRQFDDVASSTAPVPTVWSGGSGDDQITGGTGANEIAGGIGTDTLNGRQGADEILGETGNDRLNGGSGADTLHGGQGFDTINGDGGPDTLQGATENDILNGGTDADQLFGGDHEDALDGGNGPDYLSGGTSVHDDTVTYATRGNPVSVTIDGVANDGGTGDGHGDNVATDVERLIGGSASDQLVSAPLGAEIDGGPGDDTLTGGPGHDSFTGSAGNDTIALGGALNTAAGGTGDDTIIGGPSHDQLDGGAGDDELSGGGGEDLVNGGADADALVGGAGLDQLRGMEGNDGLDAVDGAVDGAIDCGGGIDSALSDAIDPAATACETDEHPPDPPGPTDPAGPGDPAEPAAGAPLGELVSKRIKVKLPPRRNSSNGKPTALPRLECPAGAARSCVGEIVLKAKRARKRGGNGSKRAGKPIRVAKAGYAIKAGDRMRIAVTVTKRGRKVLSRKRQTKGKAMLIGDGRRVQKVTFVRTR